MVQPCWDPDLFKEPWALKNRKEGCKLGWIWGRLENDQVQAFISPPRCQLGLDLRCCSLSSYPVKCHIVCVCGRDRQPRCHTQAPVPHQTPPLASRRLLGGVTAQSNNPSETQCVWLPGDSPRGVYSLSSGAELGNSASGHAMLRSLWMLIRTLQLLQCCSGHYGFFLEEIKLWVWAAETQGIWQRTLSLAWCILILTVSFMALLAPATIFLTLRFHVAEVDGVHMTTLS